MMGAKEKLILAKTHDFCTTKNQKLAVVLIHGIAADSGMFKETLTFLEEDFPEVRFITFDLLGSGESQRDDTFCHDYVEQVTALHNAIIDLKLETPLILIGHSLGSLIVAKYASEYANEVRRLVLVSPPMYTNADLENPEFKAEIKKFRESLEAKMPEEKSKKVFNDAMDKIVLNRDNFGMLARLEVPTTLIYGSSDQVILKQNIPRLVSKNSQISEIEVEGKHQIDVYKRMKIADVLRGALNETI